MPQQTMMDEVANDLALWIDETATTIALAFAPTRAPFAAQTTENQKLDYYRAQFFNPDGSPNVEGRNAQLQRLGVEGFGLVYKAIIKRWPDLRIPTPEPIEVPEQWPHEANQPPGGPMPPPNGPPGPPAGLPVGPAAGPAMPGRPPRPPMMPPMPLPGR